MSAMPSKVGASACTEAFADESPLADSSGLCSARLFNGAGFHTAALANRSPGAAYEFR
jgi:hypothetical protein